MSGGQPPARVAFRTREAIMRELHLGNQASDLHAIMRKFGHSSPDERTIARICYAGQLMKSGTAHTVLRVFRKYAEAERIVCPAEMLDPAQALVEFNCNVVGLSHHIADGPRGQMNADTDLVGSIAVHMNTSPEIVFSAASGKCVQTPFEFAQRLAVAASQVLRLSSPLQVQICRPNERELKPIGGLGLEMGKAPHQCEQTPAIRRAVLDWLNGGPPRRVAA